MADLYFDLSSGISGNMTLGALSQLIDDPHYLESELKKLNVGGYHLIHENKNKNGIIANFIDVILEEEHHHHEHDDHHHHHHVHRHLEDVYRIIDEASIDNKAKELAKRIFYRVAKAESIVHGEPIDHVHFHEVGAIDSIVDIIGTAILITKINPTHIYASVVNDGYGFVNCQHGLMSVPVPATSQILSNRGALSRQIDIESELVTPTGAAIICELAESFGVQPIMKVEKTVYGAGSKELKIPNVLKVIQGSLIQEDEAIYVLETNIDDCTSEILGYTLETLLSNGALDVFYTPIYSKKNRPSYKLTVLCHKKDLELVKNIIFKETTTIGIRYRKENRFVLERQIIEKQTELGIVHYKQVKHNDDIYEYVEYEEAKKIAQENNIPLKEVYNKLK